jgi:imidazole glycerol-phosphate synthase subunit HisH
MAEVACIATGTAKLASVAAAFTRLGLGVRMIASASEVRDAPLVVLPGVGSFAAGMARLRELAIADAIAERVLAGRPFLGICLGMQLLCRASEESPGVPGLGVLPATVGRFPASVPVPQLGWNRLTPDPGCETLGAGVVSYANSYRLESAPDGWLAATSDHGGAFVGGLERGRVVLCQFHPELSGATGSSVLRRWCGVAEAARC